MSQPSIIIVGGGVAGLAMANALAARGLYSTVLEKTKAPGEIDRGDVIHESILDIFQTWHIYEFLHKYHALEFSKFRILNQNGDEIFRFDLAYDLETPAKFTVLRHPDIERMLEEAAVNTGLVSVQRNTPCIDLVRDNGRIVGVITLKGRVNAALTILANGVQSTLRDKYFEGREYYKYPISFFNARFKLIPDFANTGFYILGKNGVMIIAPLPNDEMRVGIQQYQANRYNVRERVSSKNVIRMIRHRLYTFPIDSLEFIDAHIYPVSKSLNKSFWIPGAILVGDAAHTTHPAGGQGMNLAFQDAEVLAQFLACVRHNNEGIDSACAMYSRKRREEIKKVIRRTHFMGMMSLIESPVFIETRELLLKLANKVPALKKAVFRRITQVS